MPRGLLREERWWLRLGVLAMVCNIGWAAGAPWWWGDPVWEWGSRLWGMLLAVLVFWWSVLALRATRRIRRDVEDQIRREREALLAWLERGDR